MAYVIVSGYSESSAEQRALWHGHAGDQRELFGMWYDNTRRFADPKRIFIVNGGAQPLNVGDCQWINFSENLRDVDNSYKKLCGWSMSFLMGCMLAYHENADLIYKEQDCFAFGPWVQQMYQDCGSKYAVIGQLNTVPRCAGLRATSLVLVRHDFLLDFMQAYLMFDAPDKQLLPERKFNRLIEANPAAIAELSFGYDRSAPADDSYMNDRVFYVQRLAERDFQQLRARKLMG